MKKIKLTQEQVALVDDRDYELVSQHRWHAWWNKHTKSFYAVTNIPHPEGGTTKNGWARRMALWMSRLILGLEFGDEREADHVDNDSLDNRRANLRIATQSENSSNRRGPNSNNHSGFVGVCWHKRDGKWRAQVMVDGKQHYIGSFDNIQDAIAARDTAALRLHGEFATPNSTIEGFFP